VLGAKQFQVTTAATVSEALHRIDTDSFDVLLSDLHMPGPADGFTVASAMRHSNPKAVTLLFTGYPALEEAMDAIRLQADQILLKPMAIEALVTTIRENLQKSAPRAAKKTERVATILERDALETVADWLARVEGDSELTCVSLSREQRTGHLPKLLEELIHRLRVPRSLGTKQVSEAAVEHGKVRHSQGYSIPMIVQESRSLQVSIFKTLQNNLDTVDFSLLLGDVMTIADECDSQLKQTVSSFMEEVARTSA
jgi:DNA-binding response OmpR family regulator